MNTNNLKNKYLNFYSDCIPVKGYLNSAIYDLTRQEIVKIPNDYYDLIQYAKTTNIGEILSGISDSDSKQNILEFLAFLDDNEFVNFSIKPDILLQLNQKWERPCYIQSAIVDVKSLNHDFEEIIFQLDSLGCEMIQLRYFSNDVEIESIKGVLETIYDTSIQGVEIVVCFNPKLKHQDYVLLMEEESLISKLTIHSAKFDDEIITTFGEKKSKATLKKNISFLKQKINSHQHCGQINVKSINTPTAQLFLENKSFNGCLNKKISIDIDGMIKNCPSMSDSYGHYKDTEFASVLKIKEFKDKWHIKKDDILVCKDCEFRYACTDCRAYLSDPQDELSKPLKCGYNPYEGKWSDWRNNPENSIALKYYSEPNK